jgi:hypothetical protein
VALDLIQPDLRVGVSRSEKTALVRHGASSTQHRTITINSIQYFFIGILKVNIPANSTWSGLLSYFQGIKIKRFTK